jgi:hypothetical protein
MKWIAALLLAAAMPLDAAQINKCIDASGKVVGYASECPAGSRAKATNIKSAPASGDTSKSLTERDAEFRKRQIEQQEAAKKAEQKSAETAQRKRACDDTRAYLKTLQERHRVVRTDPKSGEQVFLKEAEYVQEIEKSRRYLAENCSS